MNKVKEFDNLIDNMSNCSKCTELSKVSNNQLLDCSLINIFKDKEMYFKLYRFFKEANIYSKS